MHDIPDGSYKLDPSDPDNKRLWPVDDIVNIVRTPLGSTEFIACCLKSKAEKHRQLLEFIKDVSTSSYPREAKTMLAGATIP